MGTRPWEHANSNKLFDQITIIFKRNILVQDCYLHPIRLMSSFHSTESIVISIKLTAVIGYADSMDLEPVEVKNA